MTSSTRAASAATIGIVAARSGRRVDPLGHEHEPRSGDPVGEVAHPATVLVRVVRPLTGALRRARRAQPLRRAAVGQDPDDRVGEPLDVVGLDEIPLDVVA